MAELVAIIATAVTAIARVVETWFKKIEESAGGCYNQPTKKNAADPKDTQTAKQPRCCS